MIVYSSVSSRKRFSLVTLLFGFCSSDCYLPLLCLDLFLYHFVSGLLISCSECLSHFSVFILPQFSSVQSLSRVQLFATPWNAAHQASLSITNSQSPPKHTSIELLMPFNHLILCCPLLFPPSMFTSIRVFSNESALHIKWWKYWSFSFNISPSNEHSGLISFRIDWLNLLAVQGTLKSPFQHHSSKASVLWCSAFFIVQLSHPHNYWKNHSLD